VTGNPNVGFNDEDLEGDFDPAKYDEAMQVCVLQFSGNRYGIMRF
jgi:hypothetical protein